LFFPFRAQITLFRLPWLTILVSLLCVAVYVAQHFNHRTLEAGAWRFCEEQNDRAFLAALKKLTQSAEAGACVDLMLMLHHHDNTKAEIARVIQLIPGSEQQKAFHEQAVRESYEAYRSAVPTSLTKRFWYPPESWNVFRMLSASVAHGGAGHLIGNLIFFFAFAAAVEMLLGPILYLGVLIALALGTHTVYSLAMLGQSDAPPTLGLSGVVMGIIALFTYFLPTARIRCFLWLIIFFRRFSLPAWLLALWYIGWDVYSQATGSGDPGVNLVAHLSGVAIGLSIGVAFFREKRHWAHDLVEEYS